MAGTTFDLSVLFKVIDKATTPMRSVAKSLDKVVFNVKKTIREMGGLAEAAQKAGQKMKDIGKAMTMKVTLPIVGFGVASLKASMSFNEAMANVATLIPGNIKRVNDLKETVQNMAIRAGQSTNVLSEGLYQVISAFGDTSDTVKILEINAKAAKAGLASVKDAVDLTSAVMKAYGDVSESAAKKAADLAFQTVKLGQTTFPELAASIGRVTPLAAQLGVKQEELFSGFATLTGVTGSANEVSTQMAAILRAMIKPTDDMKKAIKKLGYESAGAMIKEKGLGGSLKELMKYAGLKSVNITKALEDLKYESIDAMIADKGLNESLEILMKYAGDSEEAVAALFGRAEALVSVFSLAGAQADTYNRKLDEMNKSTGAMNEAFKEQTEGINKAGFAWEQFKQKIVVFSQRVGDSLAPSLMKIIEFLVPIIDWFENLSNKSKKAIMIIGAIVAAIGPLAIVVGALTAAIGAIVTVSAPIWGTIGLVVAAIAALTAGIVLLIKYWKPIKKFFVDTWTKVNEVFDKYPLLNYLMPTITFPILIIRKWRPIVSFFVRLWNGVVAATKKVFWIFVKLASLTPLGIFLRWKPVTKFFKELFLGIYDLFKMSVQGWVEIFKLAWEGIKAVLSWDPISLLKKIWEKVTEFFEKLDLGGRIKRAFDFIPDVVKKKLGFNVDVAPKISNIPVANRPLDTMGKYVGKSDKETSILQNYLKQKGQQETIESKTDITIDVKAQPGTEASINKVDTKKGDASVNISSIGYVGASRSF